MVKKQKRSELKYREKEVMLLVDNNNVLFRTGSVAKKIFEDEMIFLRTKILNETATPNDIADYDKLWNDFVKIWRGMTFTFLRNIVSIHKPNIVIICRDAKLTWRLLYYSYYKGERRVRAKMNDEIDAYSRDEFYEMASKISDELADVIGYHNLEVPLLEADDIIAVLSQKVNKKFDVIISSTDKDFFQLRTDDESVKVYNHSKHEWMEDDSKLDWEMMILVGDKSDGIPRLMDDDDTTVRFNDMTGQLELNTDLDARQTFGPAAAKKLLSQIKKEGKTLESWAIENGHHRKYMRNKRLFSLKCEDLDKYVSTDIVKMVGYKFSKLTPKTQNFQKIHKFFSDHRMRENIDGIEDFMLPIFKK